MLQLLAASFIACSSLVAVDGDTIKCDGVRMRLLGAGEPFTSGIDTPETRDAKCQLERELGKKAMARLAEILRTPGDGWLYTALPTLYEVDYGNGWADQFRGSGFTYNQIKEPTAGS